MRKSRLSEQLVEEINRIIRDEGFGDGDKFYSENELTKRLDVSRASIREAIRILEMAGRVCVRQGRGIFIKNPLEQGFDTFAAWLRNNKTRLQEHFELRMILDAKAAAYAAKKADTEDLRRMQELLEAFEKELKAKHTEGIITCDRAFHQALAKSTKNRSLYVLMNTMAESLNEGWFSSLSVPGRGEKTITEHRRILEAITNGDPDAAEAAMIEHLEKAQREIQDYMRQQG